MATLRLVSVGIVASLLLIASCSSAETTTATTNETTVSAGGIRLVSAQEGSEIQTDPPADLVILDVRTPEEFAEGHLEGAILVDFYEPDFADQLAQLDPEVPYLLYCRSGNRSGQTTTIMQELGFTDVSDIDGGILAWIESGNQLSN